jgi:hypothetical protein
MGGYTSTLIADRGLVLLDATGSTRPGIDVRFFRPDRRQSWGSSFAGLLTGPRSTGCSLSTHPNQFPAGSRSMCRAMPNHSGLRLGTRTQ